MSTSKSSSEKRNKVTILLGSNCDDKSKNIVDAINVLKDAVDNISVSNIYHQPAFANPSAPEYANAVIMGETQLPLDALESFCKDIEVSLGRNELRRAHHEVPIDVDIIIFNNDIIREIDFGRDYFQIGFQYLNSNT